MSEVLIINGHDYSAFVEAKGVGWSRNDIDSDKTTRTKSGSMRRQKIATKRKMTYRMIGMTQDDLAQLDDDLSQETFSAAYLDLHGVMTREFYCSAFSATLANVRDSSGVWEGASFSMTEI